MSGRPRAWLGRRGTRQAGPGGRGEVWGGALGFWGALGPPQSRPSHSFPRTPVGAVTIQDTHPASFSPDSGEGGLSRIPRLSHPTSRALGSGVARQGDTTASGVMLWPVSVCFACCGGRSLALWHLWFWSLWGRGFVRPQLPHPHSRLSLCVSDDAETRVVSPCA